MKSYFTNSLYRQRRIGQASSACCGTEPCTTAQRVPSTTQPWTPKIRPCPDGAADQRLLSKGWKKETLHGENFAQKAKGLRTFTCSPQVLIAKQPIGPGNCLHIQHQSGFPISTHPKQSTFLLCSWTRLAEEKGREEEFARGTEQQVPTGSYIRLSTASQPTPRGFSACFGSRLGTS